MNNLLYVIYFLSLSSLEYIGQHKENVVVAVQDYKTEEVARKQGWTILD